MAHLLTDKRSMELLPFEVDFTELLDDTDTILDTLKTSWIAKNSKGEDKTSYLIRKGLFSVKVVTLLLQNGLDGEDYTIWVTGIGNVAFDKVQPVRVVEVRVRDYIVGNL